MFGLGMQGVAGPMSWQELHWCHRSAFGCEKLEVAEGLVPGAFGRFLSIFMGALPLATLAHECRNVAQHLQDQTPFRMAFRQCLRVHGAKQPDSGC